MAEDRTAVASEARRIVRTADKAVLATLIGEEGAPYASLVMVACDLAAQPLLLISSLAEHTRNLERDSRASLLFDGTAGRDNPLTGPRVTVQGRAAPTDDAALIARYLRRHPAGADYLALGDFRLFRVAVERAHIVAGFGAIHWLEREDAIAEPTPALAEAEADIVAHMNADHADALSLYAEARERPPGDWRMTGLDREGLDLAGPAGRLRIAFEKAVDGPEAARAALVALAREARAALGI